MPSSHSKDFSALSAGLAVTQNSSPCETGNEWFLITTLQFQAYRHVSRVGFVGIEPDSIVRHANQIAVGKECLRYLRGTGSCAVD
jgi:hypothetical protein